MRNNKYGDFLKWGITAFLVFLASISVFFIIFRLGSIISIITSVFSILASVVIGIVIAFLLNKPTQMFDRLTRIAYKKIRFSQKKRKAKKENSSVDISIENWEMSETDIKRSDKLAKCFSVAASMLLLFAIVYSMFRLVIPELIKSFDILKDNIKVYSETIYRWVNDLFTKMAPVPSEEPDIIDDYSLMLQQEITTYLNQILQSISSWLSSEQLTKQLGNIMSGVTTSVLNVAKFILNIVVGIIVSIYLLLEKNTFVAQGKKLVYSLFKPSVANIIVAVARESNKIFGGFVTGKLLDSFIIGVISCIFLNIFGTPYAILVSIIVGVTNIIPFFGPFIGAIPSALLILLADPKQCLVFIIFILILQQVDGNIIGPKILGDSTGLSPFWVVVSITLGGGLFGFAGMILGVPTFALIYRTIKEILEFRLERKKLPAETSEYTDILCVDIQNSPDRPVFKYFPKDDLSTTKKTFDKKLEDEHTVPTLSEALKEYDIDKEKNKYKSIWHNQKLANEELQAEYEASKGTDIE